MALARRRAAQRRSVTFTNAGPSLEQSRPTAAPSGQNHIRSFLGHLCSSNAHGNADVCLTPESGTARAYLKGPLRLELGRQRKIASFTGRSVCTFLCYNSHCSAKKCIVITFFVFVFTCFLFLRGVGFYCGDCSMLSARAHIAVVVICESALEFLYCLNFRSCDGAVLESSILIF